MYAVDSIILDFLMSDETPNIPRKSKIALIGEEDKKYSELKDRLYALNNSYKIKVFNNSNWWNAKEETCTFDVLIGVRTCLSDVDIINVAMDFKIKFIILPCNCEDVHKKVLKLIRTYPAITGIWTAPEHYDEGYGQDAWYVLHNL